MVKILIVFIATCYFLHNLPPVNLILMLLSLLVFWILVIRTVCYAKRSLLNARFKKPVVAFFHPAADACGGGEKVLF